MSHLYSIIRDLERARANAAKVSMNGEEYRYNRAYGVLDCATDMAIEALKAKEDEMDRTAKAWREDLDETLTEACDDGKPWTD